MSLNYTNTFISVAEDSKVDVGTVPKRKEGKSTIAEVQFHLLVEQPYQFTQEDVLFQSSSAMRENPELSAEERKELRAEFFSKSQACLRASPMGKTYGWGIHFNAEGFAAAYGVETREYQEYAADKSLYQTRAMRSKRA